MLDEREYESIMTANRSWLLSVKNRLRTENRRMKKSDEADVHREVAERYSEMTGVSDVDPREILRHRISMVGPPCANCGKELRTPRAKKCLECGHVRSFPVEIIPRAE